MVDEIRRKSFEDSGDAIPLQILHLVGVYHGTSERIYVAALEGQ